MAERFGNYEILGPLASGGMARVFRARMIGAAGFEKIVALKMMLPGFAKDPGTTRMFIDEARLAATLSHANIVGILDFGEKEGEYYIALEFVSGANLRVLMRRAIETARLPSPTMAARIAAEVALGLDYAHKKTDASGGHFIHWRDGRPVEVWHHGDWLGWLQRCGAVSPLQVRAARERVVREHVDAENRHDPDSTVATFSRAKASYDLPAFGEGGQVPDHDAVRELFVGMFSVFPDFHVVSGPLLHGDDHVMVEVRLSGTQHADWAGIPSTGRSFDTRVAVLFEFEGEELVCERVYLDFGEIARQLTGT